MAEGHARIRGAFDGFYSPSSIRWWLARSPRPDQGETYTHYGTLLELINGGRSADETESLDFCFRATVGAGGGDLHGNLCICLRENAPSAGEARGSVGGDGMAALLCVKVDLEHAADQLPISWSTTQQVYETQRRADLYRARLTAYRRNLHVREIDRWLEPRDPVSRRPVSRSLTHYLMSLTLHGARTECTWPKPQSLIERDVFSMATGSSRWMAVA